MGCLVLIFSAELDEDIARKILDLPAFVPIPENILRIVGMYSIRFITELFFFLVVITFAVHTIILFVSDLIYTKNNVSSFSTIQRNRSTI